MEALVQRTRVTIPGAVFALREGAAVAELTPTLPALGAAMREFDPALLVHLGVVLARLVGGGRLPVIGRSVGLGLGEAGGAQPAPRAARGGGISVS